MTVFRTSSPLALAMTLAMTLVLALLAGLGPSNLAAQESSSEEVERQDDAYRRQMELEDARNRDKTFADTTYEDRTELEKIDKLPQESRENIREQLVDVIVENGEWEPKDALGDYPYEPTEAAKEDAELMKQEQEAWEEQIQKYHEREAAAFGSHRGPVPGPGNPTGEEGGSAGEQGQQGQEQGSQGASGSSGKASNSGQQGTYQPDKQSDAQEISTAGVSENALDFLRRQGTAPAGASQENAPSATPPVSAAASPPSSQASAPPSTDASDPATNSTEPAEAAVDIRGIIAISDLDKLEGANGGQITLPVEADEPQEDEDP